MWIFNHGIHTSHEVQTYLFDNKFVFYVDHMALVYLINKPHVSGHIVRWLLLFLNYEVALVYKIGCTYVVVDALSRLPNTTKPIGILDQTTNATLF